MKKLPLSSTEGGSFLSSYIWNTWLMLHRVRIFSDYASICSK